VAITTLNQIVRNLSEIVDKHLQIHAFKFGDPHEFYTSGSADCTEMWVQIQNDLVSRNTATYTFRMWILDGVRRGEINETEVMSDCDLIARDVIAQIRNPDYDWVVEYTQTHSLFFVTEHSPYKWAGVWFDFSIKLKSPGDTCRIPFSSPPTGSGSAGSLIYVRIYNADTGDTITNVAAPGSYAVTVLTDLQDTIDNNTVTVIDPLS
jgi:hypothetical protein